MTEASGGGSKNTLYCSFCGKSHHEVRKLICGEPDFSPWTKIENDDLAGAFRDVRAAWRRMMRRGGGDPTVIICDECVELCMDIIRTKDQAHEIQK